MWMVNAVTFRKEGVDWNDNENDYCRDCDVTFRKEGVDWNSYTCESSVPTTGHLP